jgi:HEPN domain-containing protein
MNTNQPIDAYDDGRLRAIDDNIGDYSKPQLLFRLAIAYAETSESLFREMMDGRMEATFDHARVAHYLLDHSLELYLKGALLERGGEHPKHHRLNELYKEYTSQYQESCYQFTGRAAETFREREGAPFGEFARYPMNKSGEVWNSYNCYTIDLWLEQAQLYSCDIKRLVAVIAPLPPPLIT